MRRLILIVVGLALAVTLGWVSPAAATVTTLTPTDDCYTHNGDNGNYSDIRNLAVKWDDRNNDHMRFTYIKFDLSPYQGTDLASASLDLTTHSGGHGANFVYRLWGLDPDAGGHTWTESTITGANRPAAISIVGGVGGQNYAYVDESQTFGNQALLTFFLADPAVTEVLTVGDGDDNFLSFLNVAKEQNGGAVTFILHKDRHSTNDVGYFHSKEDPSQRGPRLNVTTVPEPSTIILLAIGAVGLAAYGRRRRK
ncbi:MAG: PEP-CTERM sorting domain-containing protein [Candidatus Nealsonbacteria bacterium]|nr:PEP-CTERM sorting domain-containing protein [Candidatus Nealsonbacteria bacterium]